LTALVPALAGMALLAAGKGPGVIVTSLVLLAGSMFACRTGFSEESSVPIFGMQHTSDLFRPTEGSQRLLPYVQRMHQYDRHRAHVYLAIVDSLRYIRSFDKQNDVVFWFDMLDPHAIVYDNLACTRNWGYSVLNFNFPNITEARCWDRHEIGLGQLIAIPSVHPDAYRYAQMALATLGFDARLIDRREISRGVITFTVNLVQLETLRSRTQRR
jgi:hypothetical protein